MREKAPALQNDIRIAEIMAYIEYPYREVAAVALKYGLETIAKETIYKGEVAARRAERAEIKRGLPAVGEVFEQHLAQTRIVSRDSYIGREHCQYIADSTGLDKMNVSKLFTTIAFPSDVTASKSQKVFYLPLSIGIKVATREEIGYPPIPNGMVPKSQPYSIAERHAKHYGAVNPYEYCREAIINVGSIIDFADSPTDVWGMGPTVLANLNAVAAFLNSEIARNQSPEA